MQTITRRLQSTIDIERMATDSAYRLHRIDILVARYESGLISEREAIRLMTGIDVAEYALDEFEHVSL